MIVMSDGQLTLIIVMLEGQLTMMFMSVAADLIIMSEWQLIIVMSEGQLTLIIMSEGQPVSGAASEDPGRAAAGGGAAAAGGGEGGGGGAAGAVPVRPPGAAGQVWGDILCQQRAAETAQQQEGAAHRADRQPGRVFEAGDDDDSGLFFLAGAELQKQLRNKELHTELTDKAHWGDCQSTLTRLTKHTDQTDKAHWADWQPGRVHETLSMWFLPLSASPIETGHLAIVRKGTRILLECLCTQEGFEVEFELRQCWHIS